MASNDHDAQTLGIRGAVPDHIIKARLVEEIVALFHEGEGVTVERNVRLPSLSNSTQIREIDVLITGTLVGYPIRLPIECKNLGKVISAGQIGEFWDKLEDVGLPVRNSIYVSVSRFGRDARRRAKDHGIRLFELEGLTSDRLIVGHGTLTTRKTLRRSPSLSRWLGSY